MKSNLNVTSNLMIDDQSHKPEARYIPGDLIVEIFPEFKDKRTHDQLTLTQIAEYKQYLVCLNCKNTCAGTCEI